MHQRKRHCPPSVRQSDDKLMAGILRYKAWHGNGSINGATVRSMARDVIGGDKEPSRGWLYHFQQRTGLWFSLHHGEGGSLDMEVVE
ncbi:hypothetical protein PF008_g8691 [Phytophthora fragariae]|uniref:HTH CENPB-type domain-containing protein n=1 Tax=Phytophthora fragariae TaxID=53985 RepID=A0A6G0RZT9_9STRA|nr:hypothetical protein PF008_g8691 [Phytophthora fragariae]